MKKIIILSVIFLLSITPFALAGNISPDKELLEEMDISEAVFNALFSPDRGKIPFSGSNTSGYYLENYGAVFRVNYRSEFRFIYNVFDAQTNPKEPMQFVLNDENKAEQKDPIPELKKKIIKFYGNYAPALTGLKSGEKVTVILDLKRTAFNRSGPKDSLPSYLISSVSMGDIIKYKGKNTSDIEKLISFTEVKSVDDETEIFSDVIEGSFKHTGGYATPDFSGSVKGIYLQGYGMVFMADTGVGMIFKPVNIKINDAGGTPDAMNKIVIAKNFSGGPDTNTDYLKECEERLIKLFSKYGHTLSKVKTDEWVVIALNLDRMGVNDNFSKCVIKVKKSDIDVYYKGKIDFDNFKKKVNINYY